jgi:preprotein translocase subunit SecE
MARNRQRAKQRQAERRARREAAQGDGKRRAPEAAPADAAPADAAPDVDAAQQPEIDPRRPETAGGAPPEEAGRSDQVLEPVTGPAEEIELEEEDVDPELVLDAEEAGALESVEEDYAPKGRRGEAYELGGEPTGEAKDRPRFVQFLIHVWAELQRVQWPDRQALTTLTGVVLGFVLIAGGYLGLLDAIFSRLIQEIL